MIGDYPSAATPVITASASPSSSVQGVQAEIAVAGSPCFVADAGGSVWVTAFDGNELHEIDPATNQDVDTYPLPDGPCGMVVERDLLWVESPNANQVTIFDPRARRVVDRLRLDGGVFGLVSTPAGLWGVSGRNEALIHIDPRSRRVIDRVPIEPPLAGISFDGKALWAISAREALLQIDPASGAIRQRFVLQHYEPESVAADGDILWVSSSFEGDVLRVDAETGKVRSRVTVDGSLFGGRVVGDSYWIADNNGTIYRVDTKSGAVVDELEALGFGPIPAAGNLWTVDFLTDTVYRLDESAT